MLKRNLSSALLAVLYAMMAGLAFVLRLVRWRRRLIDLHVERCLPAATPARRNEIAAGFYSYLGELAAEIAYQCFASREDLAGRMTFDNPEVITSELAVQRRALVLSAHHANWEWLLLRCSTEFDAPLTAVYKQLDNERFESLVLGLRERFGCRMVRTRQLVQHLLEQRGSVKLLAMLADQSPSKKNEQQVWTDFFGTPTAFHAGPGWIAAKMGYRPFFAAVRRVRRGHYAVRLVPLVEAGARPEPQKVLEAYVHALEQHVRDHPEQYLWAYNRWKREKPLYA